MAEPANVTQESELFPLEVFSEESLRNGAVLLHVLGVVLVTIASYLLMKHFFLPAVSVLKEWADFTEDMAGAVLIAIGLGLPAVFTLVVGAAVEGVGHLAGAQVGEIVGEGVFRHVGILGVLGLASRSRMPLGSAPVLRDVTFYVVAVAIYVLAFLNDQVEIYESLILFGIYVVYLTAMKLLQHFAKGRFDRKDDEEGPYEKEPVDLGLPQEGGCCAKFLHVLKMPLLVPFWITLPDPANPKRRRFAVLTYLGAILWSMLLNYLLVWWCDTIGRVFGVPSVVMGLTVLALTSTLVLCVVILAREGRAALAVGASLGGALFQLGVIKPLGWVIYHVTEGASVRVSSAGLVCSVSLLAVFIFATYSALTCFRWRVGKVVGGIATAFYLVFVVISVAFSYDVIKCPV